MSCAISPINNQAACDELHDKLKGDYRAVHPEAIVITEDRLREIDPKTIPGLAESIREVGQISPIGLKRIPDTSNYRVVYGARRTLAIQSLWKDAMSRAADPNKDNDVHRFGSVHAIVYRNECDDEVCQELEIRENLDRKELTDTERDAHTMLLKAVVKRRQNKRKEMYMRQTGNGGKSAGPTNYDGKPYHPQVLERAIHLGVPPGEVGYANGDHANYETAKILGLTDAQGAVNSKEVKHRTSRIANLVEDQSINAPDVSAEKLENAARKALSSPKPKRKHSDIPKGRLDINGILTFGATINPKKPGNFSAWLRKNHPTNFTLPQIRAFRDALIALVEDLEKGESAE